MEKEYSDFSEVTASFDAWLSEEPDMVDLLKSNQGLLGWVKMAFAMGYSNGQTNILRKENQKDADSLERLNQVTEKRL